MGAANPGDIDVDLKTNHSDKKWAQAIPYVQQAN